MFQDTLGGQGGHQQVCGVTVQYRNERLIVQQVHSIITSILFRSYQSSPPMGNFKNWSWDHWITETSSIALALAVSLRSMSPWSPWLGLMAVAKAQVTWGPQPMFLSVPLQQSASRRIVWIVIFRFRAAVLPEETDDVTNQQRLYELLRQAYFTETW